MATTKPFHFESEQIANRMLDEMKGIIRAFKCVTVADYYTLAGVPSNYADERLGWTNLDSVEIKSSVGHWFLTLPDAEVI